MGFELVKTLHASLTHPGIAAIADPLFAYGGKRVKTIFLFSLPLFAKQRGGWGVSRRSEKRKHKSTKQAAGGNPAAC